ncbi:hypothetical protein PYW08_000328 [Mythimna loreyi]|uniref:Uncharacterized protein n=1 Tax=Mythimna loreyi TaxID=667449 RepID=A0ACC2RC58_9NEOP|nr:hypothetical protein PYW08_000328 [Mythimna loreyi]
MSLKWIVPVLVLCKIIVITSPSIAGVTYMDHFDFEERYRDANECNPLYWHPLHLPPYCAEVFEKLIRARLATNTPVRIKRKREKQKYQYTYPEDIYEFPYPVYQITSAEYETYSPPINPYAEVLELLKKDIERDPSTPTVTVIPNLGPVALYKQGISKKSENYIKAMAEEYVKATQKWYKKYYKAHGYYPSEKHLFIYDSSKNKTETEEKKKEKEKKPEDDKNKVHRVKTKQGDVVTIIETKNLDIFNKIKPTNKDRKEKVPSSSIVAVKLNQRLGPYQILAQKSENVANALAEAYIAMKKYRKKKSITQLKFLLIVLSLEGSKCSIDGTLSERRRNVTKPGEDPCNPLFWYPHQIPEYCHFRQMSTPPTEPWPELPIPIPVPIPAPLPMLPPPEVPPLVMPPHVMPPEPFPPIPVPHPVMPLPMPLPFGIPLAPTNAMVPVAGVPLPPPPPVFPMPMPPQYPLPYPPPYGSPYPPPVPAPYPPPFPAPYPGPYPPPYPSPYPMPPRNGLGMVPGIPGLVSPDGGINIMPFSDAYSDMLENHKQKMIRRRLRKFLNNYERPPWKSRRHTRRQNQNVDFPEENLNENTIYQ